MLVTGDRSTGREVDLVIFDCDGVLIDSEVISTRSAVTALAAIGYEIGEADAARRFVGQSWATMREDIERDWGRSLPTGFETEVERQTLEDMKASLQPIDGVGEILAGLDLPRCVASSSSMDWITLGLKKTGLFDYLSPHLFSASMVEKGKPAPDVFLHAAAEMGVSPERTLVIEDSVPGVQAGVAAGMTVVGFTGGGHIIDKPGHGAQLSELGAHHLMEAMVDLPGLLSRRLKP